MYVTEIMTPAPVVCSPDDKADYAAKLMLNHNIGEIPVCDGPKLLGVVTDRDITVRGTATGKSPGDIEVRTLMTHTVYTANEFDQVEKAADLMESKHVRRLPVVDRNGRLVGILSRTDLVREGEI
ncbi:MAG TPA: CBS domain-containing protein, partial [Thermoanaerobaculia bacterium]|nr:CBS domain-containing protein [Thermoanaerobaculia bacterium]